MSTVNGIMAARSGVLASPPHAAPVIPAYVAWAASLFGGEYVCLGRGIWAVIAIVCPDAARAVLATRNTRNRPMQRSAIPVYARDMTKRAWALNGETVIFGNDGVLLDGQNRLQACVESGESFETIMLFGVLPVVFDTLGGGSVRNLQQLLEIQGKVNTRLLGASCAFLSSFVRSGVLCRASKTRGESNRDRLSLLDTLAGIEASAAHIASLGKGVKLFGSNGLAVATHYVFGCVDADAANEFFTRIITGSVPLEDDKWSGPRHLVKQLIADADAHTGYSGLAIVAAKTVKAWNTLREGRKVGILRWALPTGKIIRLDDGDDGAPRSNGEFFPKVSGWVYEDGRPVRTISGAVLS